MAANCLLKYLRVKFSDLGIITFVGDSRSAKWTGLGIPELKLAMDAGIRMDLEFTDIFGTHVHRDHLGNSQFYVVGNTKKPTFHIPIQSVNLLKSFLLAESRLNNGGKYSVVLKQCQIIGHKYFWDERRKKKKTDDPLIEAKIKQEIMDKNQFEMRISGRKWLVDVINCCHGVPCLGYGFSRVCEKIKDEYKDVPKQDLPKLLGELKKRGESGVENKRIYFWCFLGDTMSDVLNDERLVNYPIIFIECTFLMDDDIDKSLKDKHMHWKFLEPYIRDHPNNLFVLIHFSGRNSEEEIIEFFKGKIYFHQHKIRVDDFYSRRLSRREEIMGNLNKPNIPEGVESKENENNVIEKIEDDNLIDLKNGVGEYIKSLEIDSPEPNVYEGEDHNKDKPLLTNVLIWI